MYKYAEKFMNFLVNLIDRYDAWLDNLLDRKKK